MMLLAAALIEAGILSLFSPQVITLKPLGQALTVNASTADAFQVAKGRVLCLSRDGAMVRFASGSTEEVRVEGHFEIGLANGFRRSYEGRLRIRSAGGQLELVLAADIEDLVARTVAAESPPNAPPQALAAQAILARSLLAASPARHKEFAVCDTTHCQVIKQSTAASRAAAAATAGLVLRYQDKTFAPAYSASCGGRTRTASNIGWREGPYPYFAVDCDACRRTAKTWERTFDGYDADTLREHPGDESVRLSLGRRLGWQALPSNHYELIEAATGGLLARGRGLGHGLGLCQQGAAGMAAAGASAAQILSHYYPGTAVSR